MNYEYATEEQITELVKLGIDESTASHLSPTEAISVLDYLEQKLCNTN